jgi:hypothetical protein
VDNWVARFLQVDVEAENLHQVLYFLAREGPGVVGETGTVRPLFVVLFQQQQVATLVRGGGENCR